MLPTGVIPSRGRVFPFRVPGNSLYSAVSALHSVFFLDTRPIRGIFPVEGFFSVTRQAPFFVSERGLFLFPPCLTLWFFVFRDISRGV